MASSNASNQDDPNMVPFLGRSISRPPHQRLTPGVNWIEENNIPSHPSPKTFQFQQQVALDNMSMQRDFSERIDRQKYSEVSTIEASHSELDVSDMNYVVLEHESDMPVNQQTDTGSEHLLASDVPIVVFPDHLAPKTLYPPFSNGIQTRDSGNPMAPEPVQSVSLLYQNKIESQSGGDSEEGNKQVSAFHVPEELRDVAESGEHTRPINNSGVSNSHWPPEHLLLPRLDYQTLPLPVTTRSATSSRRNAPTRRQGSSAKKVALFVFDTIPRQAYTYFFLGTPAYYFTRVSTIFNTAQMSVSDIREMALRTSTMERADYDPSGMREEPLPKSYQYLEASWYAFLDSQDKEWKALNVISVVLITAILTLLQIEDAGSDPVTRFVALTSLVCALVSLFYGCIYIIRFNIMRPMFKAAEWAFEVQNKKPAILWNVWIFLAMPMIWFAWAILLFLACIVSFIWRSGAATNDPHQILTGHQALVPRLVITIILVHGLIYFALILYTFNSHGFHIETAWKARVDARIKQKEAERDMEIIRNKEKARKPHGGANERDNAFRNLSSLTLTNIGAGSILNSKESTFGHSEEANQGLFSPREYDSNNITPLPSPFTEQGFDRRHRTLRGMRIHPHRRVQTMPSNSTFSSLKIE